MTEKSKIVTTVDVLAMARTSRATLYATLIKKLGFPMPFKVGLRKNAWFRADVEAWISTRAGVVA